MLFEVRRCAPRWVAAGAAFVVLVSGVLSAGATVASADTVSLRPVSVRGGVYSFKVKESQLSHAIRARLVIGSRTSKVSLKTLRTDASKHRSTRLRASGRSARASASARLKISRDRSKPKAPKLSSTIASGKATLHWKGASDNVGVTGYRIYSAGKLLTTVARDRRSYATPVAADRSYAFFVKARDGAGNIGYASNTAQVSATAPPPGSAGSGGGSAGITDAGLGAGGGITPDEVVPVTPTNPRIGQPVSYGPIAYRDEFTGSAGTHPRYWTAVDGGHGWGNGELQQFTGRPENSGLNGNGLLAMTARKERFTGSDGYTNDYTSARLTTKTKFSFVYGHIEARIKVPSGKGMWPAFWGMGDDVWDVGWPNCGEFDVTEVIGNQPGTTNGTLHGPLGTTQSAWAKGGKYTAAKPLSDDWHRFGMTWTPTGVEWSLDGIIYATLPRTDLPSGARWVWDHPFYVILSLSVGGSWPGAPDASTVFPKQMLVDWVRIYR